MTVPRQDERPPSRVQELAAYLREEARARGPDAKLPTARELGRMFSMSQNTVSATLDLLEAQHVISRRQGSGIFVSPKIHRKSIALLFYSDVFHGGGNSPFWGIFWSLFAEEMERRLASQAVYMSFHLVIQAHHDRRDLPEDIVTMVQLGTVHGVMAVGIDEPTWGWLKEQGVPVVAFAGPGDYFVELNSDSQVQLGVSQLVERGCHSIGAWLPAIAFQTPDQIDAFLGFYRSQLQTLGMPFDPDLVRSGPASTAEGRASSFQEQGYQLAREVFGAPEGKRPDGLYVSLDMITAGALVAFHQLHIDLSRDLCIATHANKGSPVLFGAEHDLILVEIDPAEIVQAMFAQMDAVLAGQHPANLIVKPRLPIR